jgi:hypothetical protein
MPPRDSEREEITITNANGPGLWVCAREAILKHHGFSDVKSGQRKLVIWLRDNYEDMLEDPNARIDQLFFKLGSRISIPGRQETVEILGGTNISTITGTGDVQIHPRLIDIELLDKEGNKIEEKWVMGKPLVVSIHCRNGGGQTKIKFAVYQKKEDGTYEKKQEGLEGTKNEGEDKYTLEWKYEYSGEELKSKPVVYIKAYGDNTGETDSKEIEIGMDIKLVVVDADNVILGKAKIDIEFSKNEQKDEQGNQSKRFSDMEADSEGKYQWEELIPDQVTIMVRTPIERPFTIEKRNINQTNDEILIPLSMIDGSEPLTNFNNGKIDNGKTNIIKLPVRFLNSTECTDIKHILGDTYFGTPINVESIQIIERDPTVKQIKELLRHFNITIDPQFTDSIIQSEIGGRGMSLPNGIIYLPQIYYGSELTALLVHEAFHQYQYGYYGKQNTYNKLVAEMSDDKLSRQNPYEYNTPRISGSSVPPVTNILSLEQIQTYEGRAAFIQHFAFAYYGGATPFPFADYKPAMRNGQQSGINTNVPL